MTDHHIHPELGDRLIVHRPRRRGRAAWPVTILIASARNGVCDAGDRAHDAWVAGEQLTLEEAT